MGELVGERRRETEKERERRGSETDVPKLYTYNEYELSVRSQGRIKSVSWEYSCDEEYLEEFNKGKISKYCLLLAVLPQNRLDPDIFSPILKVFI